MHRIAIAIVAVVSLCPGQEKAVERPPNIVLLFADDAGYADFGFQKQPAADMKDLTPNIDSIAKSGVMFTSAYMSGCVCSPSRAGMLSGRYQTRFGHEYNIPPGYMAGGLPLTETLMPKRLKKLGYTTGIVGKWHLGYPAEYHPNKRGFDWFYGCLQGSRSYFAATRPTKHRVIQENGEPTAETGYVTDRFGDAAVRFIGENKDRPFFLFLSFTAPHGPLQAKESDLKKLTHIEKLKRRKYAGLVKCMDDNVGKVLAALKRHQLDANTLVIFTNDNGGQTLTGADNAPLRGKKGSLLEGGIRVPMCARWPGKIKAGTTVDDPVISLDLLPTFVAAAGGRVDPQWKLDGVNLLPRLTGETSALESRVLFWRQRNEIALRMGDHKIYIANRTAAQDPVIYDLTQDIGEARDAAAKLEDIKAAMTRSMLSLDQAMVKAKWGGGQRKRRKRKKK